MVDSYSSSPRLFPKLNINMKVVANNLLLKTEDGTRLFFPLSVAMDVNTLTGATATPASISIGTNPPNYNNILPVTNVGGVGILDSILSIINANINSAIYVPPNTEIYMRVSNSAVNTGNFTINSNLMGYYR